MNLARGPQRRLYCNRPPDADRIQLCWRHLPSCLGLHPWAQADQVSISQRKRSGASSNRVLTTATQKECYLVAMTNYPKHEPHSAWILVSLSNTSRMSVKGQQANKKPHLVLRGGEVSRGRQGDVLLCTRCGTSCSTLCTQRPLAKGSLRHTRGRTVGRGG